MSISRRNLITGGASLAGSLAVGDLTNLGPLGKEVPTETVGQAVEILSEEEKLRKLFDVIHEHHYGNAMYGLTGDPFYMGKKASQIKEDLESGRYEERAPESGNDKLEMALKDGTAKKFLEEMLEDMFPKGPERI